LLLPNLQAELVPLFSLDQTFKRIVVGLKKVDLPSHEKIPVLSTAVDFFNAVDLTSLRGMRTTDYRCESWVSFLRKHQLLIFSLDLTKSRKFAIENASELQSSNLNFLLYCKLKWQNKANRGELVFAKVFHAIQ
jgi:hypothetical protein